MLVNHVISQILRYISCFEGKAPKGAEKDFEKLSGICEAPVVRVQLADVPPHTSNSGQQNCMV